MKLLDGKLKKKLFLKVWKYLNAFSTKVVDDIIVNDKTVILC